MIEISDIIRALGGKDKLLVEDIQKESDMDRLIRDGIPYVACKHLRENLKITVLELGLFIGLKRLPKKDINARLSSTSSDRLYRLARLYALTSSVVGSEAGAAEWLKRPQWGLGGVIPLEMAKTEIGAKEVENLLGRIEHSVF